MNSQYNERKYQLYQEESILTKAKQVVLNVIRRIVKFANDVWSLIIKKINELKERFKGNTKVQALLNRIRGNKVKEAVGIAKKCQ